MISQSKNVRKVIVDKLPSWALWEATSFILLILSTGFCIPVVNDDIGWDPPQPYPMDSEDFQFLQRERKSLLQTNKIRRGGSMRYVNPVFVVHNNNKSRLVLDARRLNSRLPEPPTFRMGKVTDAKMFDLDKVKGFVKTDIKSCFHTMSIAYSSQRYLSMLLPDDEGNWELYCWTVVPFGLSWAPYLCNVVYSHVEAIFRRCNIDVISYCDDWLFGIKNDNEVYLIKLIFETLGITLSEEKSIWKISEDIEFLANYFF
jgi:hypothetical protein